MQEKGKSRGFGIRPFQPDDAEAILALHVAAIVATSDSYYTHEERNSWASGKSAQNYLDIVAGGETVMVAADLSEKPIGFCGFADAEIRSLYVDPLHQDKGIGTALMRFAESALIASGVRQITIHSGLPALGFYQAHGYVTVSQSTHRTSGGLPIKSFMLVKKVTAISAET
ncbi:GNAT family N-acetyltransferase [Martelella lutilitoris]|nr:GNAT family N-acetyltransferase [Martelella lutilitoris]